MKKYPFYEESTISDLGSKMQAIDYSYKLKVMEESTINKDLIQAGTNEIIDKISEDGDEQEEACFKNLLHQNNVNSE